MSMFEDRTSLANLGHGAAVERFDDALKVVIENILDPNTDAKAKRVVNLKCTISPKEGRAVSDVTIECTTKMAGAKVIETTLFVGKNGQGGIATEHNPQQELPLGQIEEEPQKADREPLRAVR